MKPFGVIYIAYNTVTGRAYIGQTIVSAKVRWRQHVRDSKRKDDPINRAIRKYGDSSFRVSVLHQAFDRKELDDMEKSAIFSHESSSDKFGYNVRRCASGVGSISEESRMKMRMAKLGKKHSPESRAKIVAALTGRPVSQETRDKTSRANKGKRPSDLCIAKSIEHHRTPEARKRASEKQYEVILRSQQRK
jgi:group I intron endonuclease